MQNSKISPEAIPWTPVSGEDKVCFFSSKMHWNNHTAIQNSKKFPVDTSSNRRLRDQKVCFRSPKIYWNSHIGYTAVQSSQILRGQYPGSPF